MGKLKTGTVLKRMKGFYYVEVEGETRLCRVKGSLFKDSTYDKKVAVGDRVEVDPHAAEDAGLIYQILPRRSRLSRPFGENQLEQVLVSNADHLLIVAAVSQPKFRFGVVDRFLIAALRGDLHPVIVLNKVDLLPEKDIIPIQELYSSIGYDVLLTSVVQKQGLEALRHFMTNHVSILAGHSGVGKSSLIKALFPEWDIKIGMVNKKVGKGRHTTTLAEMYPIPEGGYIVDTPGIREMGLYQVTSEELDQFFTEFGQLSQKCKFKGCTHRHEPECGVKQAVENQEISKLRYESYCNIFETLEN